MGIIVKFCISANYMDILFRMKSVFRLNSYNIFYILVVVFTFISCNSSSSQAKYAGSIIQTVDSCANNNGHKYELYLPKNFNNHKVKSFFILIDSHGDGKFASINFKTAADKYGVGIAASDLIQNNDPDFLKEISELVSDVRGKYGLDTKIYLAGFSGGARMSLVYAVNNRLDGVMACGALAGPDQLYAIPCPVVGVVGMDDFNFMEVAQYILKPDSKPANTHVVLTKDSHAWPDTEIVTSLVGQLVLANGGYSTEVVKDFITGQQLKIKNLNKKDNVINAACITQNLSTVDMFENIGDFMAQHQRIINSSEYKHALEELSSSINLEINLRKSLLPAFLQQDSVWWQNEIASLKKKSEKGEYQMEEMTYKRILGFIGIACYSMSRQFLQKNDLPHLEQTLMVYRLAEPENEDMKHFTKELERIRALGK